MIIRRDNVEHLIMTGGPQDLVIETGIAVAEHARRAGRAAPPRADDHAPRRSPAPIAPDRTGAARAVDRCTISPAVAARHRALLAAPLGCVPADATGYPHGAAAARR